MKKCLTLMFAILSFMANAQQEPVCEGETTFAFGGDAPEQAVIHLYGEDSATFYQTAFSATGSVVLIPETSVSFSVEETLFDQWQTDLGCDEPAPAASVFYAPIGSHRYVRFDYIEVGGDFFAFHDCGTEVGRFEVPQGIDPNEVAIYEITPPTLVPFEVHMDRFDYSRVRVRVDANGELTFVFSTTNGGIGANNTLSFGVTQDTCN